MTRAAWLSLLLAMLPAAAGAAQPPALHDKPWYLGHPAERQATLRVCHSDASYSHLYDCQNAEAAETGAYAHREGVASNNYLTQESWWSQNPVARAGALRMCAERGPGSASILPYCSVVQRADNAARR